MTDGASLRSTAWVLSGLSVWALSLADYVAHNDRHVENLTEEDPVELGMFIVGACALMWAAPLAQLAGSRLRHDEGFRLIQFFAGGLPSVLIQAFAWSCYATAVFASVMSLLNPSVRLRGLKTGLGLLGLAAQALVNISVDLFEGPAYDPDGLEPPSPQAKGIKRKFSVAQIVGAAMAFLASLFGFSICLLADIGFLDEDYKPMVWNVAMGCFTASVLSMTALRGRAKRVDDNEVIQVAKLFAFLLFGSATWIYLRLHATPAYAALKGTTVGLGIVGSISAGLSLYAVLWEPVLLETQTSSPKLQLHAPHGASRTSIIYRVSLTLLLISAFSRFYSTSLAAVLSIVGAPLAHFGAWLVYRLDDGFKLARALQGGASFSIFQGVGWMAYAIALLGILVFALSSDLDYQAWGRPSWEDASEFLHPIAFVAHISLLWSKQVFKRVTHLPTTPSRAGRSNSGRRLSFTGDDADGLDPSKINTEARLGESDVSDKNIPDERVEKGAPIAEDSMPEATGRISTLSSKVALVLVAFSATTHFVIPSIPQASILISLASALALVVRTPQPFTGSAPIIVQQALGWTLFCVSLMAQGVLIFNAKQWPGYDLTLVFVRAFGLIVLVAADPSQTSRGGKNQTAKTPRRRKRTDEEMSLDLREVDSLIALAKRPSVLRALEDAKRQFLGEAKQRRWGAIVAGVFCIAQVHVNLGFTILVDIHRFEASWVRLLFPAVIAFWVATVILVHIGLGPRLWGAQGYRAYQPFRGGLHHVVLQALGWTLSVIASIAMLVCYNYGVQRIELDGLVSGVGLVAYVGELVLLVSLAQFDAEAPHLGFAFDLDARGLGWFLSIGALALLLGVDVAIVRFGLEDTSLVVPVIVCAWVALALSVPLAYMLERRESYEGPRKSRFGVIRVLALAVWTFSMFVTLFLIGRAATLSSITTSWLPSKTGVASVVAQGMMAVSSDTARAALFTQQVAFLFMTFWFIYLVMPLLRAFLDGPMWYYAYFFKTWKHSRSPDGLHPLERTVILRNINFGMEHLDVMVPAEEEVSEKNPLSSTDEKSCENLDDVHPPVIYLHGGGHLFVKREILAHQVTPLCRAGIVVYSVEYPLSPEAQFPAAVVCVLQAVAWVKKYHCKRGGCVAGLPPRVCPACTLNPVKEIRPKDFPCRCCPHQRGCNTVQMLGDSAGGNLAALATALLCNPHLLEAISPYSGHEDFSKWSLPKVQRLCVVYGLLGRKLIFGPGELGEEETGEPSWTEWVVKAGGESAVGFILNQYAGPHLSTTLRDKVVLNDLTSTLSDFAPETLLLCGTADPLLATNRQALKLVRQQTGRECRLVEYEGSIHGFAGWPVQWSLGRWIKDAYPATCEMVKFCSGGQETVAAVDFDLVPVDYSPLLVFPLAFAGIAVVFKVLWAMASLAVTSIMYVAWL